MSHGIVTSLKLLGTLVRKARSFVCYQSVDRFYVLESQANKVQAEIEMELRLFDTWSEEAEELFSTVKGHDANWKQRFERGHCCYLAACKDVPMAFVWASPNEWRIADDDPAGELAQDVVFWYDGITTPQFRGKRVFPSLFAWAIEHQRDRGCRRGCTLIEDRNIASQKTDAQVGFQRTRDVVRIYRILMCYHWRPRWGSAPNVQLPS